MWRACHIRGVHVPRNEDAGVRSSDWSRAPRSACARPRAMCRSPRGDAHRGSAPPSLTGDLVQAQPDNRRMRHAAPRRGGPPSDRKSSGQAPRRIAPSSCWRRATARRAFAPAARNSGTRRRRPASASAQAVRALYRAACGLGSAEAPWRHTPTSPSVANRNHAARRAAPAKIPARISPNAASQASRTCPVLNTAGAVRSPMAPPRTAPDGSCSSSSQRAAYSARSASAGQCRYRAAPDSRGISSPVAPGSAA
jgi:hypothetical protein